MTEEELLSLVVVNDSYTEEEFIFGINSILPALKETGNFSNFWDDAEDILRNSEPGEALVIENDVDGFDINGGKLSTFLVQGTKIVTFDAWIEAIKEFFEI